MKKDPRTHEIIGAAMEFHSTVDPGHPFVGSGYYCGFSPPSAGLDLQPNVIKLRIFDQKQPPLSPFSKGDFCGRSLNLMTLICNLNLGV